MIVVTEYIMAHMDQSVTDNGVIMLKESSFTTKEACQILQSRDVYRTIDAPVSKPKGSEVYLYRNCSVKKPCFFACFVTYLCGITSYANNTGGFFICTINSSNETKFSKFG